MHAVAKLAAMGIAQDGLPLFHGWDGQPLRVPAEEYQQRVTQTRKSMQQADDKQGAISKFRLCSG